MPRPTKLKKLPTFKSDRDAERFVDGADLSQFDLSGGKFVRFELKPKDRSVNLEAVRKRAKRAGLPYQRFIRMKLEEALRK